MKIMSIPAAPKKTVASVDSGLPIPAGGLTSPLRKVSSDDLRETVRNYDQVAEYLSGTRFNAS